MRTRYATVLEVSPTLPGPFGTRLPGLYAVVCEAPSNERPVESREWINAHAVGFTGPIQSALKALVESNRLLNESLGS